MAVCCTYWYSEKCVTQHKQVPKPALQGQHWPNYKQSDNCQQYRHPSSSCDIVQ